MKSPLKTLGLVLFGCFALLGTQLQAASFTWTGTAGASWGTSTNWSSTTSGTWPSTGDTVVIADTGLYQNVKYDVPSPGTTGTIGSLNIVQPASTSGTNKVSLWRNLVVTDTNGITLGGANGGTSMLYLDASDTGSTGNSVTLTATNIYVNTGGILGLSLAGSNGSLNSTVNGNVNVSGGLVVLYSNSNQWVTNAGVSTISGSFVMSSGTVAVGVRLPGVTSTNLNDPRLTFGGNTTITGGVVAGGSATINFNGVNTSISGLSASNSSFTNLTLYSGSNQTFACDSTVGNVYINALTPRANGNLTRVIGSSISGGTLVVGALNIGQGVANATTTVQLSSDMMATSATPLGAGAGVGGTITNVGYNLDLNGYNFFASNVGISLGNPGVSSGTNTAIWNFVNSNSSTPGTVYANFFNFTSGSTVVNVGLNSQGVVVLTATAANQTSNLGYVTNGTITASSVFAYIGTGTANLTSTTSSRALGCLSVGNGSSASTLNLTTMGPTIQGNITVNANAVLNLLDKTVTETGDTTVSGGLNGSGSIYNNGSSGGTATLILNASGGDGIFSGTIGDSTSGSGIVAVTLDGYGTQYFTGTNTYSGQTTINSGATLQLGDGINDGFISGKSVVNNGTLIYSNKKTQTYDGVISGNGDVTKYSAGTQILTGNNTYTGATTISSGTLQIGAGGTTGALSGGGDITNYGSLVFNRSDKVTQGVDFGSSIAGSGKLVQAGSGMLILNGANTFTGKTTILAGSIEYANRGALYNATTSFWKDTYIDVKSGAGLILMLGGANGFTSSDVDTLKAIGTGTSGLESGAYLGLDTTNGNFTYSSAIANTNSGSNVLGVQKLGANTLTLTGVSTYTGATVVAGGELDVNGSLAAGSAVTVQTGATLGGSGTANGTVSVQSASIKGKGLNLGDTTFTGASSISGTTKVNSFTVSSGTTTASGATTSTGNITVNVGAKLTNTGVLNGSVNVSGLLNGGGTINGALAIKNGGELASGVSPMTTTITGNLTVESGGKISEQINGVTTPGTDSDLFVVKGTSSLVSLNAGSILNLSMSLSLTSGQTIMIIRNESNQLIVGTFSTVTIGGNSYDVSSSNTFTYNGVQYMLLYNINGDHVGTIANDLELAIVPEPGTWAMLAGGLGLLLGAKRMRRRTA